MDSYAGAYIDDGKLHIAVTDIHDGTSMKNYMLSNELLKERITANELSDIVVEPAVYSYRQLQYAQTAIMSSSDDLNVSYSFIDDKENAVIVGASSWSDVKKDVVKSISGIDNVRYETASSTFIDDAVSAVNGAQIVDTTQRRGYSLGSGIMWKSNNKYGYITSGHNTSVGDVFTYNGLELGTVVSRAYSGALDVALIEKSETAVMPGKGLYSSTATCSKSGSPINNESITMYGATTGVSTGKITAKSFSVNWNGVAFNNLIKCDYTASNGDSGAPIIANRSDGNVFIGIHKGRDTVNNYTVAVRWDKIRDAYNLLRAS